jgi:class 3 adenylate cyclase
MAPLLILWPVPPDSWRSPDAVTFTVAIVSLVVAGWTLMGRPPQRRNGALMLVQAASISALSLEFIDSGPWPLLITLERPVNNILLGLLLLRWPRPRLSTRAEVWTLRYAWCSVALLSPMSLLAYDPTWDGHDGRAWWLTLVHDRSLHDWLFRLKTGNAYGLLPALFLVLLGIRLYRAARRERRQLAPVVVSALALVGLAATNLVSLLAAQQLPDLENVLENVALFAVPLSVVVSLAVRRIQRALAVEALLQPSRLADADAVRLALSRALGDRELTLALWSPELSGYVSPDGVEVGGEEPGRLRVDVAGADGSSVARLGVDPRLADSPDLLESVVRAASVALDNARLEAELRVRQRAVEESSASLNRAEDRERSLSRLVPGGLADRLRQDPEALSRTERLTVTVLMSDIRGYSGIAETTPAADLAGQLGEHRRAMNAVILRDGGTVMQYVGDAVLAVFGAPDPLPDHPDRALRAAAGMHAAQEALDREWAARGLSPFGLGIGICTGEVAAAFLGSEERVEYTVVGDTVNLAARLTDAARPAGTTIVSAATVTGDLGLWCLEVLPPFRVKGRTTTVSAYRITGREAPLAAGDPQPAG